MRRASCTVVTTEDALCCVQIVWVLRQSTCGVMCRLYGC